jgi:hypothetical protein
MRGPLRCSSPSVTTSAVSLPLRGCSAVISQTHQISTSWRSPPMQRSTHWETATRCSDVTVSDRFRRRAHQPFRFRQPRWDHRRLPRSRSQIPERGLTCSAAPSCSVRRPIPSASARWPGGGDPAAALRQRQPGRRSLIGRPLGLQPHLAGGFILYPGPSRERCGLSPTEHGVAQGPPEHRRTCGPSLDLGT